LSERRGGVSIGLTGAIKLTHRTPHSSTLITAGIKYDKILFDIFIGGKFKGVKCGIERHYGRDREGQAKTRPLPLSSAYPQMPREIR
jgi:hypothetical protein